MPSEPNGPIPPFDIEPVHPDLLEFARQTLDVEDFLKQIQEIEETGGYSFESIIREIEEICVPRE